MWHKLNTVIPGLAIMATAIAFTASAVAQAPTLAEQLQAQYKVAKLGSDTNGISVTEPGTLLAIQKGGILGVPSSDKTMLTTKYEGGVVHSPNSLMVAGKKSILGHFSQTQSQGQTTHLFAKNDKVYPTKVDVNVEKDTVTMAIIACDTCNKTDPPTYNKANVVFQFPKGSLASAQAGSVEDTIGQLLAISDDTGDQGNGDQGNNPQGGNDQGGGDQGQQGGGQQQQQQAEPETIQMGMTTDQVVNAMGKPEKIVNLGPKQLYIYKDMKVTFIGGKVADVQ